MTITVNAPQAPGSERAPRVLIAIRETTQCHLTVVMSAGAARFVTPQAIRHIADELVDASNPDEAFAAGHMKLAADADLILVLPCSAATLPAAAHGLAHDLIPAIVLASPKPVIFLPSMHRVMWEKPPIQRNVLQLRADGHEVPNPIWRNSYELADPSKPIPVWVRRWPWPSSCTHGPGQPFGRSLTSSPPWVCNCCSSAEFVVEDAGVIDDYAVEHAVELLGVDAMGAFDLAVEVR
ncbi:flavoprotein [Streptomyces sp. NPDC056519]|uniref:flavoprotein n=1 Tax=Streptomyces sp. NPDC056519 TaxID=3345849 RepID=UPI0036A236EF